MKYHFSLIAACTNNYGIGYKNKLPWKSFKCDMDFFKSKTLNSTIIMGKNTFNSMNKIPLKNRNNIVVTSTPSYNTNNLFFEKSFDAALQKAFEFKKPVYVIGGAGIFDVAIKHKLFGKFYLNYIENDNIKINSDVYLSNELINFLKNLDYKVDDKSCDIILNSDDKYNVNVSFYEYINNKDINEDEYNYLKLMEKILLTGSDRSDRTSEGTLSLFGEKLQFDLNKGLPILTTKYVNIDKILSELLWFLSGNTDSKILLSKYNNGIWEANTSKEFLEKRGLPYREGDMGPGYSFQWRHSGSEYISCDTDYHNKGIDQINELIENLKKDPHSRRHIVCSWNPKDINLMALPPCHCLFQFYVNNDNTLDCQLYQRSGDYFLGVPYNITSYSILTYMIAQICGFIPGKLHHVFGDVHIYKNHIEQCKEMINRIPMQFPQLKMNKNIKKIENFTMKDFELINYNYYPGLYGKMAI